MSYAKAQVAVDAAVFTIKKRELHILLEKREKEPFKGLHSLPGGLLLEGETAEATIQRKLAAAIEHPPTVQQFHTFTSPDRDPRRRTISVGYVALVSDLPHSTPYTKSLQLAFDHADIAHKARELLRDPPISFLKSFLPEKFPLNDLHELHEVLSGEELDNRNFRRKILASDLLIDTGERETNVSHRPAKLFSFR